MSFVNFRKVPLNIIKQKIPTIYRFGWFKIKPDPDEFLKNYGNYMGDIPLPPLPQTPSSPFDKKEKEKEKDDYTGTESESSPPIDGHKPPKKHKKEKIKNERK